MTYRSTAVAMAGIAALLLAGCGLGNRSLGSIFDSGNNAQCRYNDTHYGDGAGICRSGRQYRCDNGSWKDLRNSCTQNAAAAQTCAFDGRTFPSGKTSCQSGSRYRCDDGSWTNLGGTCGGAAAVQPPDNARSCQYHDVTVASQSTICRSGRTARCEDGRWRNIGSACQ